MELIQSQVERVSFNNSIKHLSTWPILALKDTHLFSQTEQEIKQGERHIAFFGQLHEKRPLGS